MSFVKAAVIGDPVSHSLSPTIHGYWIRKYNLQGSYEAVAIKPDVFKSRIDDLVKNGYAGFNITIPHKENIIALCKSTDAAAKAIGAVNTVVIAKDGTLVGFNTDALGFIDSIKETVPDFSAARGPALVLGAGGAARAIVHALKVSGATDIRIANRTYSKAQALAAFFGAKAVPWEDRANAASDCALVVNTTALGMKGQEPLDFDVASLPASCVVSDIVYVPRETPLLRDAGARGLVTVGGLGMLLHQARYAFEKWFGVLPDVTPELRQILLQRLGS